MHPLQWIDILFTHLKLLIMSQKQDMLIFVDIRSSFEEWKALFDQDYDMRSEMSDAENTIVTKVDDKNAMVFMPAVDMEKMQQRFAAMEAGSDTNAKLVREHVNAHNVYLASRMPAPQ